MRAADAIALAKTWLPPRNCPSGNVRNCLVKLHQGQGDRFYKNSCALFSLEAGHMDFSLLTSALHRKRICEKFVQVQRTLFRR